MTLIQWILITLLSLIGVIYLIALRSRGASRLVMVSFVALGFVCVLNPDLMNRAAHAVGVGRGADLLTYLVTLGSACSFILLYAKLHAITRRMTELSREFALHTAIPPPSATSIQPPLPGPRARP